MKIETPQILWHNGIDNEQNKNAAIFSISMIESGVLGTREDGTTQYGHVLATAGTTEIHLWKVNLRHDFDRKGIFQKESFTKVEHMLTLTRHDATVNTIKFSPDGLHLATAGDGGSIIIWSVPPSKRGNQNGRHFWAEVNKEQDLTVRVVNSTCESIYDIDWSKDSKRLAVGTLDHNLIIYEDENYDANHKNPDKPQADSQFRSVYRNARDHTHYIQGVAYDPKGVYVASMSCDRSIRVYQRKPPAKKHKKLFLKGNEPLLEKNLIDSKLDFARGKQIKHRYIQEEGQPKPKKHNMFTDEATSVSYFRRLRWTADGAYLIAPCALWHTDKDAKGEPELATHVFARHKYDEPCKVLPGLETASRVICPNPVLFEMPESYKETADSKIPCRSIFAVLTENAVLIYDTYHNKPLVVAKNLHFSGLTDAVWSADGRNLIISSSDGYISMISFEDGEMGKPYTVPTKPVVQETTKQTSAPSDKKKVTATTDKAAQAEGTTVVHAPPTEKKRVTPTLVSSSTTVSPPAKEFGEQAAESMAKVAEIVSEKMEVGDVEKTENENAAASAAIPSAGGTLGPAKKKKKRITPTLVSSSSN